LFYKVIPVFNGIFTLKFTGRSHNYQLDNIHDFIFLVIDERGEPLLVDTGFDADYIPGTEFSCKKNRKDEICEAIKKHGFRPEDISTVIQTHMHWDHTGGMNMFPNACFYVQADEFKSMINLRPNEEPCYCPSHWMPVLPRIRLVNGNCNLKPGIRLIHTGGHTPGHQVIEVKTRKGSIILAGDAPFDYDSLWEGGLEKDWDYFKKLHGSRFYWDKEVLPTIKTWLGHQNIHHNPSFGPMGLDEIKMLGDRILYSHDPDLLGFNSD